MPEEEIDQEDKQAFVEYVPEAEGWNNGELEEKMSSLLEEGRKEDFRHLQDLSFDNLGEKAAVVHHTKENLGSFGRVEGSVMLKTFSKQLADKADLDTYIDRVNDVSSTIRNDSSSLPDKAVANSLASKVDSPEKLVDVYRVSASDVSNVLDYFDERSLAENMPENAANSLQILNTFSTLHYWAPEGEDVTKLEFTPDMKELFDREDLDAEGKLEELKGKVKENIGERIDRNLENMPFQNALAMNALDSTGAMDKRDTKKFVKTVSQYGSIDNYFRQERPDYFERFLRESDFDEDKVFQEEEFKVPYSTEELEMAEDFEWDEVEPIEEPKEGLKEALSTLKDVAEEQANKGDAAFWSGLGKKLKEVTGEMPDDMVEYDYADPAEAADEFLDLLETAPLKREVKESKRMKKAALHLVEVRGADETEEERQRIFDSDGYTKASLAHEYWTDLIKRHHIDDLEDSMKKRIVIPALNKKAKAIDTAKKVSAGAGYTGEINFKLSDRDLRTACKGFASEDCTKSSSMNLIPSGFGQTADPAAFNFEMHEDGNWVGNVYLVSVNKNGETGFLVDKVQTRMGHPITGADPESIREFSRDVLGNVKRWGDKMGADFLYLSKDPSNRSSLRGALQSVGGTKEKEELSKPGGFGHLEDFGIYKEYIEGLGSFRSDKKKRVNVQEVD